MPANSTPISWRDITSWNSVGWYVALFIGVWGALLGVGAYWPAHVFFMLAIVLVSAKWAHAIRIRPSRRKTASFLLGLVLALLVIWGITSWTLKRAKASDKEKKNLEQLSLIPKLQLQVQELQTRNSESNQKLASNENKIEDLTKVVVRQSQELAASQHKDTAQVVGTVTGGDSFCYAELWSDSDLHAGEARTGTFNITLHLVGNYPLRGVRVHVFNYRRSREIISDPTTTRDQKRDALRRQVYDFYFNDTLVRNHAGKEGPIILDERDDYDINIFFSSLNGDWSEEFHWRKVGWVWAKAIRVLRQQKEGEKPRYWTKIDKAYPRNPQGEVDWN